jgi:formate dehydrogenase major subunit
LVLKKAKIHRRTFLKISGGAFLSCLFPGSYHSIRAAAVTSVRYGKEIPSRCTLCSMGCGTIFIRDTRGRWIVEGDPDCPLAKGSLCARGTCLTAVSEVTREARPLYRFPGSSQWSEIEWEQGIDTVTRRIKDFRDRELEKREDSGKQSVNRFNGVGVIAGGNLTNEEAYLVSKLFRALGIVNMDTTVRASRGQAVLGLFDVLGLPGPTHPPSQVAQSDVAIVVGCNPAQTSPLLSRYLDEVRRRSGTVIVIDPRWTETMKPGDLWLRVRPGCDAAILGGFLSWILKHGEPRIEELLKHTDASFFTLTETMGKYEKHKGGKLKGMFKSDATLSEPYTIYQRLKEYYARYDLSKIAGLTGVDPHLFRRACKELNRTGQQEFSACFILGSGALARPSGSDAARMAAMIQTLLGNLKKRGGGVVVPVGGGNAQGTCDMGLLAPFLPGYLHLPIRGDDTEAIEGNGESRQALEALARAWFQDGKVSHLPVIEENESLSISTIFRDIQREEVRALIVLGADPVASLPNSSNALKALEKLDLLVVLDVLPSRTGRFWQEATRLPETLKTEVIFLPIEPPAARSGSLTDAGRRVRSIKPADDPVETVHPLLDTLGNLGTSIKRKFDLEKGPLSAPLDNLRWPLWHSLENITLEINGVIQNSSGEDQPLSPGKEWPDKASCGNRLYRGWLKDGHWQADTRDDSDPHEIALFENWGWFWPGGVADPFSWLYDQNRESSILLRWTGQDDSDAAPPKSLILRSNPPVRFWRVTPLGSPFPEHYEPFHSPLPDFLTGGRSDPSILQRDEEAETWDYLSRKPEDVLLEFPVIMTAHRTGNMIGSGGALAKVDWLAELGSIRLLEMGPALADDLGVVSGDLVAIRTPHSNSDVRARALVTGRLGTFNYNGDYHQVASITYYGAQSPGTNELFSAAFSGLEGGTQIKAFLAKIIKVR